MRETRMAQDVRVGILLTVVPALSTGCGLGTAVAGTTVAEIGGGGGDNAATVVSLLELVAEPPHGRPVAPTATIRFRLTDPEGDRAEVTFLYAEDDGTDEPDFELMDLAGEENPLAGVESGELHTVEWRFAEQIGEGYRDDVIVRLEVTDGLEPEERTGVEIGNDAPRIQSITLPAGDEFTDIVFVDFRVSDSSSDSVDVDMQYSVASDECSPVEWKTATPVSERLESVETTPAGVTRTFAWKSAEDLADQEAEVRLRFEVDDRLTQALSMPTRCLRIDNDSPPSALYDNSLFVNNVDETRGIPIPFLLSDRGSTPSRVIVQWKRPGGFFPELPTGTEEIEALLADAGARRERQICTEQPRIYRGRAHAHRFDPRKARLLELGGPAAGLRAAGLAGRSLEILRRRVIPERVGGWNAELRGPVAVLPIGSGPSALVLDVDDREGGWRLSRIDLATRSRDTLARSAGEPSAMAFDPDRGSVLVASSQGETWRVQRVALAGEGTAEPLVDASDGETEGGRIRGIASLGTDAALITVGTSLIRLDLGEEPRAATLLAGLAAPCGLAVDPLNTNHVYVAESDAARADGGVGRVLRVALDTYRREEVFTDAAVGEGLERPTAIALERSGARLLAVTDANPADGVRELRGVDLGGRDRGVVFELVADLPADTSSLAVGRDGLRALALPSGDDLAVGGGVLQRRTIVAPTEAELDPGGLTVTVDEPFEPPLVPNAPWRVAAELRARTSESGVNNVFVWDSRDVLEGKVLVRITPLDTDVGTGGEGLAAKRIRAFVDPVRSGGKGTNARVVGVVAADLDGDGWLDLAAANPRLGTVTVFFQAAPPGFPGASGAFPSLPDRTLASDLVPAPHGLVAADLNDDGRLDLAVADEIGGVLGIYYRTPEGDFADSPVVVNEANPQEIARPVDLQAADMDRNGLVDLVVGSTEPGRAVVFFQQSVGEFVACEVAEMPNARRLNRIAVADLDGDGRLDLVLANTDASPEGCRGHLRVFLQVPPPVPGEPGEPGESCPPEGPATFAPTDDRLETLGTATTEVIAADLDGDGRLDLAAVNGTDEASEEPCPGEQTITVYFQSTDAPGRFPAEPSRVLGNPESVDSPGTLVAPDLDGDGRLDLVSANQETDNLTAFLQVRPEGFASSPDVELGGIDVTRGARSLAAADLDGDGRPDLASANFDQGDLTVFRRSVPGEFASFPDLELGTSVTTRAPSALAAADLDGDGLVDLVSANRGSDNLALFFQEAPGQFQRAPGVVLAQDPEDGPESVRAADLDGDGRIDLVVANAGSDEVILYLQKESGAGKAFGEARALGGFGTDDAPASVDVSDLNGDGLLDIAATARGAGSLALFLQSAEGGFEAFSGPDFVLTDGAMMKAPLAVRAADVTGDGRIDLASANRDSDNLTLFFQPETGFETREGADVFLGEAPPGEPPRYVGRVPVSLAVEDLNGDGLLDLAAGNSGRDALTVAFQPGTGFVDRFSRENDVVLRNVRGPQAIVTADLNGDGLCDLVSANESHDRLTAFFQTSPGRFPELPDQVLFMDRPAVLVAADLNADGEVDLAAASHRHAGFDTIAVFFGGK